MKGLNSDSLVSEQGRLGEWTLAEAVAEARGYVQEAIDTYSPVAVVALVSGGKDSVSMLRVCRPFVTHVGMANTTIGSEITRQFVRDLAAEWSLPLIEKFPPVSYEAIVLEHGFPGAGDEAHRIQWIRLKDRCFQQIRGDLKQYRSHEKVLFLTGVRSDESDRRTRNVTKVMRDDGAIVWVAPLAHWSTGDVLRYKALHDLPLSPVSEQIGMSGECACGSKARLFEIEDYRKADPDLYAYIKALEERVKAADMARHPENRHGRYVWGWGAHALPAQKAKKVSQTMGQEFLFDPRAVCQSCDDRVAV